MKKSELRKAFLHKRMSLEMSEMQTMTKRIYMHLNALLEAYPAKVLHIFLTQAHKKEVDTWQLISSIRKEFPGVKMAAPFVIPGTREMLHFALGHKTTFVPNAWGIPEPNPADSVQIKPDDIDVVIVPLLAFDEKGYRVGYGGGFYDRFLAVCRPEVFKIGISFFGPVERIDDVDVFDIPLDACITPDQVFYWKKT